MTKKDKKRTFVKMGYSHLDTAEIVTLLNRLLSNYEIYKQKLKNFQWNISGEHFFEFYKLFNKMFQRAVKETGEIGERIRLFGQRPVSTYVEYIDLAKITEVNSEITPYEMAKVLLKDIRELLENMEEGIYAAMEIGDNGTEFMLKSFIYNMEREHWMLTSWIKQNL